MKRRIAAALLLLALISPACSGFVGSTTTIARTPTATPFPTLTPTPAPTEALPPPTHAPDLVAELFPEGQPASEWNGIPIMPGALAGEGDEESYVFTIQAAPETVQAYYELELAKLGWQPFAQGDGHSSVMLIFADSNEATLTVSIISKGDKALVLLVK